MQLRCPECGGDLDMSVLGLYCVRCEITYVVMDDCIVDDQKV